MHNQREYESVSCMHCIYFTKFYIKKEKEKANFQIQWLFKISFFFCKNLHFEYNCSQTHLQNMNRFGFVNCLNVKFLLMHWFFQWFLLLLAKNWLILIIFFVDLTQWWSVNRSWKYTQFCIVHQVISDDSSCPHLQYPL